MLLSARKFKRNTRGDRMSDLHLMQVIDTGNGGNIFQFYILDYDTIRYHCIERKTSRYILAGV